MCVCELVCISLCVFGCAFTILCCWFTPLLSLVSHCFLCLCFLFIWLSFVSQKCDDESEISLLIDNEGSLVWHCCHCFKHCYGTSLR